MEELNRYVARLKLILHCRLTDCNLNKNSKKKKDEEMKVQRGDVSCPRSVSDRAWISPKDRLVLKPVLFSHLSTPGQIEVSSSGLQLKFRPLSSSYFHSSALCGASSVLMENSARARPQSLPLGSRSFKVLYNLISCEEQDLPKESPLPMRRRGFPPLPPSHSPVC